MNARVLDAGDAPLHHEAIAGSLALVGAGLAFALAPFANQRPGVVATAAVFPLLLITLIGVPAFKSFRLGLRLLVVLLALRPLVDMSQPLQTITAGFALASSSLFSLQEAFAALFVVVLIAVWVAEGQRTGYTKLPNLLLILLLALTSFAWLIGGLGAGTRGFVRTAWGLVVALLLGPVFRTEQQVDVFIRMVFYSSSLVLLTLALNLGGMSGTEADHLWRLGGQYGTPNALAGVVLSFFLYGLYVVCRASSVSGRILSVLILSLLGVVIVFTQSRTVGALMLLSVLFCLWANRRRGVLLSAIVSLFLLLFATAGNGWRLTSTLFVARNELAPNVLTLQGRVVLWGDWMKTYMDASLFEKLFGLGWGTMLNSFLAMLWPTSSVTESSFLWFLIGTGALGVLAFCSYLLWILFKSWRAWRKALHSFEKQFALLVFLVAICFVVEGFTTDVASAPNADVYVFSLMSIFASQSVRRTDSVGSILGQENSAS